MSTPIDERPHAREREQRLGFVSRPRFEDYREKYANFFQMERRNGILQVQMHSDGGAVIYGLPIHNAWSQLWMEIGNDPDNEVLIFGGATKGQRVMVWLSPSRLPLNAIAPREDHASAILTPRSPLTH